MVSSLACRPSTACSRNIVAVSRSRLHECKKVVDHYWIEDVEFEVALRGAEADREIVAVDLRDDHRHRFGLRGIHFARHDR